MLHVFCGFQFNITLTIKALYGEQNGYDTIDIIEESVYSKSCKEVEQNGSMGIGWFNLTYCMHNLDSKNAPEISVNSVTTTLFSTISIPCTTTTVNTISIPYTTSAPVTSSTDQPLAETSSSTWAWIAVATLFILLSIIFFAISIVMICIIRNKSTKLKDCSNKHACEQGEKTCQ